MPWPRASSSWRWGAPCCASPTWCAAGRRAPRTSRCACTATSAWRRSTAAPGACWWSDPAVRSGARGDGALDAVDVRGHVAAVDRGRGPYERAEQPAVARHALEVEVAGAPGVARQRLGRHAHDVDLRPRHHPAPAVLEVDVE